MRPRFAVLLALALPACSGTTTPPDAADALALPDGALDAAADIAPDIAPDIASDIAPDIAPDAPPLDVAPDAPADAATGDADAGGCDLCVAGTYRCDDATGALQRCARSDAGCLEFGAAAACDLSSSTTHESCYMSACALCGTPEGGVGCAPLCTTDAECGDRGYARCVDGRCTRRGYLRCAMDMMCRAYPGGLAFGCTQSVTVSGATFMVCSGTSVLPCSADVMCPPAYRCSVATGLCEP
jgi:hypothetical protein